MGRVSIICYLAVLALIFIQGTQGLKCYSCRYLNHDGQNTTDSTGYCLSGTTPNDTYLGTCSLRSAGLKMLSHKDDGSVELRDADAGILQDGPNMTVFGCYKFHGEGTFQGKKRTWTQRGCFLHYKELKSQCKSKKTMKKLKDGEDLWSSFTYTFFYGFAEEDKVTGCYCAKDGCNSATSISLSLSIWMGAATLALVKQWLFK